MKIMKIGSQVFINDSEFCKTVVAHALCNGVVTLTEFINNFDLLWGYDAEDLDDLHDLELLHQYVMAELNTNGMDAVWELAKADK
jgi:hypothetical protein